MFAWTEWGLAVAAAVDRIFGAIGDGLDVLAGAADGIASRKHDGRADDERTW